MSRHASIDNIEMIPQFPDCRRLLVPDELTAIFPVFLDRLHLDDTATRDDLDFAPISVISD